MNKKVISAVITLILSIALSVPAFAQETQVGYTVNGNYEITIPAYIDLNAENQLIIEASFISLMDDYHVNVSIAEESLNNGDLVLTSSEGNSIGTEIQIITEGSGSSLTNDGLVATFGSNGLEFGGTLQIMPLVDQYTSAGQYYGTLMFETEMVQYN